MGLDEHVGRGRALDRVEEAGQFGRRGVERASDERGVFVTLAQVGVLLVVNEDVSNAEVRERREDRTQEEGTETKGDHQSKSKTSSAH
jgi:hypothetical protein